MRAGNQKVDNKLLVLPVAAGEVIEAGTMIALNTSGYASAASAIVGLRVVGRAEEYIDNSNGIDAAYYINAARGTFVWLNDGTITETDLLKPCYVKDNQTVSLTDTGSSIAGLILGVETDGITVDMTITQAL